MRRDERSRFRRKQGAVAPLQSLEARGRSPLRRRRRCPSPQGPAHWFRRRGEPQSGLSLERSSRVNAFFYGQRAECVVESTSTL